MAAGDSLSESADSLSDLDATPIPEVEVTGRPAQVRPFAGRLLDLAMSIGGVCAAMWITFVFMITVYNVVPLSDFGRFYHTTVAHYKNLGMYEWNPTVPGIIPGLNTLNGEEATVDLLNLNPPHFHLVFLLLARLPVEAAYCIWVLCGFVSVWLSVKIVVQELHVTWTPRIRQLAWLVFLGSAVTTVMINIGQIGWVLLLPTTLMWLAARRNRWVQCGILFGVLASIKPFYLIFVPYFLLKGHWRTLGAAGCAVVGIVAVGAAVFGVESYQLWLACLEPADSWGWLEMNASLWGILTRSLSANLLYVPVAYWDVGQVKLLWVALGGMMGLLTVVVAVGDRSDQRLDRAFALLLIGSVLFSPLGWIYYLPLPMAPLVALLIAWRREEQQDAESASWSMQRWWLLGLALAGLFCQPGWTRHYQFEPVATLTLGSIYFWATFLVWLTLVRDGLRHVRLPGTWCLVVRPSV